MLDTSSMYLPPEVITDILVRVTVKTILRCKLVCKEWKSLIENSFFTDLHYSRQSNDSSLLLCHYNEHKTYVAAVLSHQYPYNMVTRHPLPLEFGNDFLIEGSCNGLVFVVIATHKRVTRDCVYSIWNPATREVKHIPKPLGMNRVSKKYDDDIFGFGFYNNDFKLLRVTHTNSKISSAKLYSTNANSWRKIIQVPYLGMSNSTFILILNEFMHLLATPFYRHRRWIIVTFDMCNERFGELALPSSFYDTYKSHSSKGYLSKLEEQIAVIFTSNTKIDIWVMSEYCIVESLTKKFTLDLNQLDGSMMQMFESIKNYPLFLFNDDKFVLHGLRKHIYNYKSHELRTLERHGVIACRDICLYKESLVSVRRVEYDLVHSVGDSQRRSSRNRRAPAKLGD